MSESFLLTFLKNVYSNNANFCVVCLRTCEERRLEKPNYVKKFAASINQPFMFTEPNHMACYICERQAAAALRYRKASNLASFAICVMNNIKKNHKKCEMIRTCTADKENLAWLTSVLQCESEIIQLRTRSQLLLTEVLVVGSPTDSDSSNPIQCEDTPMFSVMGQTQISSLGSSRDLYVVPDDIPRESQSLETTQNDAGGMNSIIIYDDEDDPIDIKHDIPPTNQPVVPTKDPLLQNNDLNLNITKNAANNLVPFINLVDNTRLGGISMLNQNTVIESAPTDFILHPIVFDSGKMTVPTLSACLVNGKLVVSNNLTTTPQTPQIAVKVGENLDFISDPNKVTNVLNVLSHHDTANVFTGARQNTNGERNLQKIAPKTIQNVNNAVGGKNVNAVGGKNVNAVGGQSVNNAVGGQNVNNVFNQSFTTNTPVIEVGNTYDPFINKNPSPNKSSSPPNKIPTVIKYSSAGENPSVRQHSGPALLRTDRIDWEDKIPMDVISFVDKNDTITKRPRYSNNVTPALGISDVVSLSNEESIIDLC